MGDPGTWAAISAAIGGVGLKDSRDARKEQKQEQERLERERKGNDLKAANSRLNAKKSQYTSTRDSIRRATQRGRLSTILDSKDTVG